VSRILDELDAKRWISSYGLELLRGTFPEYTWVFAPPPNGNRFINVTQIRQRALGCESAVVAIVDRIFDNGEFPEWLMK